MTKTTKKYIISISILLIVTALAIYFVLKQDPRAVFDAIKKCDLKWLISAISIVIITYLVEGVILTVLAKMYKRNYPYWKGVLNTFIGTFFSGITPSSSGGQFAQAYTFSKQGVKITNAASILFMHFIVYQAMLILYGGGVLIFKFNEMRSLTQTINIFGYNFDVISLAILGFSINLIVLLGLFFLAFSKRIHSFIIKYGIGLGAKLKIIKNPEDRILRLNTKVETFRIELKRLCQNWPILITVSILFLIKQVLYNSTPFFIANSMGLEFTSSNNFINYLNSVSMTTLVSTITSMVPIPGASGGAELVFQYLYGGTFFTNASQSDISALILLWRSISFYLGLILGFIVFISYHESPKNDSFLHGDNKTLLELNVINLNEEGKICEREKKEIDEDNSIINIEPQLLTVEDIEKHFALLKQDLSKQLKKNERSLIKEESKKEEERKNKKKSHFKKSKDEKENR